ncbi:MAG: preprotein translocase subunit YajC [Elusimicrobiota bacterium]
MNEPNVAPHGAAMFSSLMPIFLIFIVFYFLLIRPQSKRQKEHRIMINGLKKGDRVITASGLYGTIHEIQDNIVKLKISDLADNKMGSVNIQILKSSISAIVNEANSTTSVQIEKK